MSLRKRLVEQDQTSEDESSEPVLKKRQMPSDSQNRPEKHISPSKRKEKSKAKPREPKQDSDSSMMIENKKPEKKKTKEIKLDVECRAKDEARYLIKMMERAYKADRKANQNKKSATEKIKRMPEVEKILRSSIISQKFLEISGQNILILWLSKLPDHNDCNISFRTRLLQLILDLKIPSYDTVKSLHLIIREMYQIAEKEKILKDLQFEILGKWDKLRTRTQETKGKNKERKRKENKLKNQPQVYVERNLATIIKNKEKLKEKKKLAEG